MHSLIPRPYQEEATKAVHSAWERGTKRPAVVLPCGLGKTVIIVQLVKSALAHNLQCVILVHRDELVKQTVNKLQSISTDIRIGVVKAERNEIDDVDVVVASVQTLGKPSRLTDGPKADIVIIDECHHAAATSYQNVLHHYGCFDDGANSVGFTATMERGDSLKLGDTWQEVVYHKPILYGIVNGYLVDVRGQTVRVEGLDLDSVAKSHGDYAEGSLSDALERSGAPHTVAQSYLTYAAGRRGILFAPTVNSAYSFATEFNAAGIPTEVVVGETSIEDRELVYKRVAAGETLVICSCMVLTEGFDLPEVEVAVMARATRKPGLYTQMAGRVLRPAPWSGKKEALVLDVCGVTEVHRLATISSLIKSKEPLEAGESLLEAEERATGKKKEADRSLASTTGIVDLFRGSRSSWLRTDNNVWFIPTRECVVFIYGKGDEWMVYRSHSQYALRGAQARPLIDKVLTQELAMAWAESEATEMDPSVPNRGASWRRKSARPSEKQVALLNANGYKVPDSKSEASDILSVHFANRIFSGLQMQEH